MQISAPLYRLKRHAKRMARQDGIPLHQALDRVAADQGFRSWSHLAASASRESPADRLLSALTAGDLVLLAARPGHGKTLLGLELASKAPKINRIGHFFTLDYHERDISHQLNTLGVDPVAAGKAMTIDTSDAISAAYIIGRLAHVTRPPLIVIDYLQLLDQKRSNPGLNEQIGSLRSFATETGAVCAIISQIDRTFDLRDKAMPDISDVRLPNPIDLGVFSKTVFLHDGNVRLDHAA